VRTLSCSDDGHAGYGEPVPTPRTPSDAVLVVDKPAGTSSHGVVARVRRIAGTRKVGHAGTLDPMATGVLVLGVGRATRLLGHLMTGEKGYDATIRLGEVTTTDDAEGESVAVSDASALTAEQVGSALRAFVGDIEQRPSAVSAIKVDGRRAYARVRAGEQVELAARPVHVEAIEVHDVRVEHPYVDVDVSITCSAGTYIRAIARDLGEALAVGGHLTRLRRTRVGRFTLAEARTLEELEQTYDVLPIAEAARRCFPAVDLAADTARLVRTGRTLVDHPLPDGPVAALFDPTGEFLALYEQRGADARAVAVFVG
jgi:tRNA pseudouridine55 synthase